MGSIHDDGPKRKKSDDFWEQYEDELGEFGDEDYNDGDWEGYEGED